MARGKIQIKKIENVTNRQVTYSKRRSGLLKKAYELTVLCDAKVSILMLSSTGKLHEYISPPTTTKQFFDEYQKTVGIDLWKSHYERMQERLKKLEQVNKNLRREIRQRTGEIVISANDMEYKQMVCLEEEMENSVKIIRERKFKVMGNQIDTCKKKVRNGEEIHRRLLHEFDTRNEDPYYGLVDNGGDYGTVLRFQNEGLRVLSLCNHSNNLHAGAVGSDLPTFALLE